MIIGLGNRIQGDTRSSGGGEGDGDLLSPMLDSLDDCFENSGPQQAASTGGYISSPSQSGSQSQSLTQSLSFQSPTGKGGFPNKQGGQGLGQGPGSQEKGSSGKKPSTSSSSSGGMEGGGGRNVTMGDRSGSASSIQRLHVTAPASTFATPTTINPMTGDGGYGRTSLSSAFTGDEDRSLSAYGYDNSEGYASDKTPMPGGSAPRDRLPSQQVNNNKLS